MLVEGTGNEWMGFLRSGYIVLGLANLMHWLHHIQLTLFALLANVTQNISNYICSCIHLYILCDVLYWFLCSTNVKILLLICMKITGLFSLKKKIWNLQFSVKNCQKLLSFWFEWNFITVIVMILFIVWDLFYRVLISCLSKSLQPMLLLS